jgi:CheY-like chemotaxis protein
MQRTILIADDNDDIRMLIAHELYTRGYRVIMASTGQQAVDKSIADKPDLILMDITMPGKDGTQAAADIKANPATGAIPVVFLTSLIHGAESVSGEGDEERITLPKSIKADDLARAIEKVLSKKKGT